MTTTTATITEIANDLVAHCSTPPADNIAYDNAIWDKHFAEGWISIEGNGKTYRGREEVTAKYKEWEEGVTCHSCKVEGPFVGQSGFSVIFDLDMECKNGSFPRMTMKEVANYTVEGGKITKEEFCYQCPDC